MKLSIIIPVFNEERTIEEVLKKIDRLILPNVKKEIIVINDASTDKTPLKIEKYLKISKNKILFLQHEFNQGKGATVRTGISHATGDYIIIQDADLEYDSQDMIRLIKQIKSNRDVIYGTRLNRLPHLSKEEGRPHFLLHYMGNRFLSLVTSVLYGQWITDMETCYKLFPTSVAKKLNLESRGFEFEPEITVKLLKKGLKIKEIPITTKPRGYEEGKKLNTIKDGTKAIWALFKYRFSD